ncbi:RND family transporter [Fibrobacterota bacterium]
MKKKFIKLVTSYPKPVMLIMVLLSLAMASGIFNLGATGAGIAKAFRTHSVLTIAKNIVLYPVKVYITGEFKANPEIFRLKVDDNILNMLPKDLPSRITWERLEDVFGSTEFTLVAFGTPGKDIINQASLDKLIHLSQALEDLEPVDRVQSLYSVNAIEAEPGGFTVSPLLEDEAPADPEGLASIKAYLQKNPDIASHFLSGKGDYTAVMVVYKPEGVDEGQAAGLVSAVADSILKDENVVIAGLPFLRGVLAKNIVGDLVSLMPIVILVLFAMLVITLRTPHAIPLVFMVVVLSVLPMLGLMGWFHQKFMLINATMPTILLTIAAADSIHVISRFFREIRSEHDQRKAVQNTMDPLMLPIFLTSITTMAAFLTLLSSPIPAMVPYGIFVSFGVAWAWLLSVTLLPARLTMIKLHRIKKKQSFNLLWDRLMDRLSALVCGHPKAVLVTGIAVILVSLGGVPLLQIEVNFNKFFPKSNPIRKANDFIDKNMNGVMNISFEVRGKIKDREAVTEDGDTVMQRSADIKDPRVLRTVRDISSRLEQIPGMGRTMSIANIIAKMNRAVNDDDPAQERIPDTRNQAAQLLELYSMSGDPEDFENIVDYDYSTCLVNATMKSISTSKITRVIQDIEDYVEAKVDTSIMNISATGFSVFLKDFVGLVIKSSLISIFFSMALIFIISLIFFRSPIWAAIAILPLFTAVILNFGLMGYLGIELSHVTALMTSIIIGVGIDFAMHFIAHARLLLRTTDRDHVVHANIKEVGPPIIINAAAVSVGFTVLLLSNFIPIRFLGSLVGLSMVSCAFGALTVMASIIYLMRARLK